MDELDSDFGSLSMRAAEWKPSSSSVASAAVSGSDLNPEAVKEFVPGRGWSTAVVEEENTGGSLRNKIICENVMMLCE
jgi:hypothetical protein